MGKKQLLITQDTDTREGGFLPRGAHVWLMERAADGTLKVERKGRLHTIPESVTLPLPIPPAAPERLAAKDSCFLEGLEAFEEIYRDDELLFSIYRCRRHGAFFLEDVRGGIGIYSRFILLAEPPEGSKEGYRRAWREYHALGDDELDLMEIASPFPPGQKAGGGESE